MTKLKIGDRVKAWDCEDVGFIKGLGITIAWVNFKPNYFRMIELSDLTLINEPPISKPEFESLWDMAQES